MKKIPKNMDLGLLLTRIGIGLLFIWGGLEKFFEGFLGGVGLEAVAGLFGGSMIIAIILSTVELIAGIFVLIGYRTQESSGVLAIVMLGALIMVHIPSLSQSAGNWMNVFIHIALVTTCAGLAFTGAGKKAVA